MRRPPSCTCARVEKKRHLVAMSVERVISSDVSFLEFNFFLSFLPFFINTFLLKNFHLHFFIRISFIYNFLFKLETRILLWWRSPRRVQGHFHIFFSFIKI